MNNDEIIKNAFSIDEQRLGFIDMNGYTGRILSQDFINKIKKFKNFNDIKIVLDVGSRDGCQALELSRFFPNAKIYAFEPNPDALIYVKNNASLSKNISIINAAVGIKTQKRDFYKVVNGNIGASSLYKTNNHYKSQCWIQEKIEVDCIRMDEWLIKNSIDKVDVVWADVQGAESEVFKSFGKYLNNIDFIATEISIQKLYEQSTLVEELDMILDNFYKIDFQIESSNTEADVIYINKIYKE